MVRLKANEFVSDNVKFELFQFLMVRLKACLYHNSTKYSLISIPYGAIKSILYPFANKEQN